MPAVKRKTTSDPVMNVSPPKRMTRARAAAKSAKVPELEDAETVKSAAVQSKKMPSKKINISAVRAASKSGPIPRRTREKAQETSEENSVPEDEPTQTTDNDEPPKRSTRQRTGTIEHETGIKQSRVTRAKKSQVEKSEETLAQGRTVMRGRVPRTLTTNKTKVTGRTAIDARKKVTFQDVEDHNDKENQPILLEESRDDKHLLVKSKAMRKSATTKATKTTSRRGQTRDVKPLSPKKTTQVAKATNQTTGSLSSEDELAKSPIRQIQKSPIRPPPGFVVKSPVRPAFDASPFKSHGHVGSSLVPASPTRSTFLASPVRRLPSPSRNTFLNPSGSTLTSPPRGLESPSRSNVLQSVRKIGPFLGSPSKTNGIEFKKSLLQSPARRLQSPTKSMLNQTNEANDRLPTTITPSRLMQRNDFVLPILSPQRRLFAPALPDSPNTEESMDYSLVNEQNSAKPTSSASQIHEPSIDEVNDAEGSVTEPVTAYRDHRKPVNKSEESISEDELSAMHNPLENPTGVSVRDWANKTPIKVHRLQDTHTRIFASGRVKPRESLIPTAEITSVQGLTPLAAKLKDWRKPNHTADVAAADIGTPRSQIVDTGNVPEFDQEDRTTRFDDAFASIHHGGEEAIRDLLLQLPSPPKPDYTGLEPKAVSGRSAMCDNTENNLGSSPDPVHGHPDQQQFQQTPLDKFAIEESVDYQVRYDLLTPAPRNCGRSRDVKTVSKISSGAPREVIEFPERAEKNARTMPQPSRFRHRRSSIDTSDFKNRNKHENGDIMSIPSNIPLRNVSSPVLPKGQPLLQDSVSESKTPDSVPRTKSPASRKSKILTDVVVHVDVHTSEGADASQIFVDLLTSMGARCIKNWTWSSKPHESMPSSFSNKPVVERPSPIPSKDSQAKSPRDAASEKIGVTHVVFKDGSKRTLEKCRELKGKVLCVGVSWVLECERQLDRVAETDYLVDTSMTPRGGHNRRKSMEPASLSRASVTGTPGKTENVSTESDASFKRPKDDILETERLETPSQPASRPFFGTTITTTTKVPLKPSSEIYLEPITPTARKESTPVFYSPGADSHEVEPFDLSACASPKTPYFLAKGAALIQQTCPGKVQNQAAFPLRIQTFSGGVDRSLFGDVDDELGTGGSYIPNANMNAALRTRIEAARRKSLAYEPKVKSPLGREVRSYF